MLDSILNADVLYYAYTVIGFLVFGLLLLILKPIVKRTKNKIDDKIVETTVYLTDIDVLSKGEFEFTITVK